MSIINISDSTSSKFEEDASQIHPNDVVVESPFKKMKNEKIDNEVAIPLKNIKTEMLFYDDEKDFNPIDAQLEYHPGSILFDLTFQKFDENFSRLLELKNIMDEHVGEMTRCALAMRNIHGAMANYFEVEKGKHFKGKEKENSHL